MKTEHRGASEERQCILRKVRSLRRQSFGATETLLLKLEAWIGQRVKRFKQKKGGL